MKTIYLIAGPNGSGKTTNVKELLNAEPMPFINADDIYAELNQNEKSHTLAGRKTLNILKEIITKGKSFVLESTLSGISLYNILAKAQSEGYQISISYIFIDKLSLLNSRITLRVLKGGHYVEPKVVKRRYSRSLVNFWLKYRQIANEWTVYNNGFDRNDVICFGELQVFTIIDTESYRQLIKRIENAKKDL